MSDDSGLTGCCAACFGICCLACCQSILVSLNFKKPGTRTGSTQRGCCKNWGESTEDDGFDEAARRERLAKSSKKRHGKNPDNKDLDDGGNEEKNPKEGNEEEEGGGDRTVNQQPGPSPEMSADTADATPKLEEGTESGGPER